MPTSPEPKEFNRPAIRTFESLAPGVRDWVTSSDASSIIIEINDRYKNDGGFAVVIPRLITRLLIGSLAVEEFHRALAYYLPLLNERQVADICLAIKNRILRPVGNSLFGLYAINLERLKTAPVPFTLPVPSARVVVAEKTIVRPPVPASTPRSVPVAPPQPKARIMEMSGNMVDLRRAAGVAQKSTPAAVPQARVMEAPHAVVSPAVKRPAQTTEAAAVLESQRPFGLSESAPVPTAEHAAPVSPKKAVVPYHDEHPTVPPAHQ